MIISFSNIWIYKATMRIKKNSLIIFSSWIKYRRIDKLSSVNISHIGNDIRFSIKCFFILTRTIFLTRSCCRCNRKQIRSWSLNKINKWGFKWWLEGLIWRSIWRWKVSRRSNNYAFGLLVFLDIFKLRFNDELFSSIFFIFSCRWAGFSIAHHISHWFYSQKIVLFVIIFVRIVHAWSQIRAFNAYRVCRNICWWNKRLELQIFRLLILVIIWRKISRSSFGTTEKSWRTKI